MKRYFLLLISVFGLYFSFPVFAATLSITSNPVNLTAYNNTGTNVTMLNLTLNLTGENSVNVDNIIVTFNSTNGSLNASQTNLSVCLYNSTVNSSNNLGCGTVWNVSGNVNQTNITLSNFNITNSTEKNLLIVYEVYRNVTTPINISLYINDNSSITLSNSSVIIDNSTFPISSNFTQIQDLHASASISPRYVDTNVENQTLSYLVNVTGDDQINDTKIIIPNGYTFIKLVDCQIDLNGDNVVDISSCDVSGISGGDSQINITQSVKKNGWIRVNFTANTSSTSVNSTAFNSIIDGGNLTGIPTDVTNGSTNVTTKQLINVTNVAIMKNTAVVNGTDYWEFNFTLNISANVSGLIQFKMNPWNSSSANATLNLTNATTGNITYYASLRNESSFSTTNKFNVTNEYNITQGISLNATENNIYHVFLRMVIPLGTPIASDWWTTYSMLFRALP